VITFVVAATVIVIAAIAALTLLGWLVISMTYEHILVRPRQKLLRSQRPVAQQGDGPRTQPTVFDRS
jgi:hypothetical protein